MSIKITGSGIQSSSDIKITSTNGTVQLDYKVAPLVQKYRSNIKETESINLTSNEFVAVTDDFHLSAGTSVNLNDGGAVILL